MRLDGYRDESGFWLVEKGERVAGPFKTLIDAGLAAMRMRRERDLQNTKVK